MANRLIQVDEEDAATLKFPKEFDGVETLMISEVRLILESRKESADKSGSEQRLNEVFVKTLEHCKTFDRFGGNKEKIAAIRRMLLPKKMHPFELAQLANLCPETCEEARTFIPSLEKNFQDDELTEILNSMLNL
ncbi:DNA-directed RNA polymerase II subunit RPB4, partial [Fragariocoptes setiger]